jgi:hypothetical protein
MIAFSFNETLSAHFLFVGLAPSTSFLLTRSLPVPNPEWVPQCFFLPTLSDTSPSSVPFPSHPPPMPSSSYSPSFPLTFSPSSVTNAMVATATATSFSLLIYSLSGFDLLNILSRIANHPNPRVNLSAIDDSCSLVIVDVRRHDCPIVYCSDSFCCLAGYRDKNKILGRNCRFL